MPKNNIDNRLIIKFNSGMGAILCSDCYKIIKTGKDFTEQEMAYARGEGDPLPEQWCTDCKDRAVI